MSIKKSILSTKSIVQVSLLISLALVTRNLSFMIYFGGAPGMRVGFSGIFAKIIAILFGPFLGGTATGIVDLLGYAIRPEGAYIPLLTISAAIGGVIIGVTWKIARNVNDFMIKKIFFIFTVLSGILGVTNHIFITFFPQNYWTIIIDELGKYRDLASIGLEIVSCLGFIFFISDIAIKKMNGKLGRHDDFLKIVFITGLSGIIITTLNTYILQTFIPALGRMGFFIFLIPRLVEEILMTLIQAYIISLLLAVYRKNIIKNRYI